MSGAGKTFWATQLASHGFTHIDCDAIIATRLRREVAGVADTQLADVGRWMGFPHEPGFRRREALYLAHEMDALRSVIAQARQCADSQSDCVIDTGGSVIYADTELLDQLHRYSTVVYLTIPATMHRHMALEYLANPRPLIWNGLFNQAPGESPQDAYVRCYSELIRYRESRYAAHCCVRLDYDDYRQPALTADHFVQHIQAGLMQRPWAAPQTRFLLGLGGEAAPTP
jgi:shikimate kinase